MLENVQSSLGNITHSASNIGYRSWNGLSSFLKSPSLHQFGGSGHEPIDDQRFAYCSDYNSIIILVNTIN
jgi:hypothetical protein